MLVIVSVTKKKRVIQDKLTSKSVVSKSGTPFDHYIQLQNT